MYTPNAAFRLVQALQRPAQDAIKSFFLPPAASQLGCDWRGMSLRQSRQVFLRYRQPWLMMHVSKCACNIDWSCAWMCKVMWGHVPRCVLFGWGWGAVRGVACARRTRDCGLGHARRCTSYPTANSN